MAYYSRVQTPLANALRAAIAAAEAAKKVLVNCECAEEDNPHVSAVVAAEGAVDGARWAVIDADESRSWTLSEGGYEYACFIGTRAEVLAEAARASDNCCYLPATAPFGPTSTSPAN